MPSSSYHLIRDAVSRRLQVSCQYQGLRRVFSPHCIGWSTGMERVLGFQFAGSSSRGLPPEGEWRCFEIAKMTNVEVSDGPWHTGHSHTRPQTCVKSVDIEVR